METVLIIDSDVQVLDALCEHLSGADFTPFTAAEGLSGLQAFYNHQPSLVILDVRLPRMDGWTVVSRIREISQVPIIALSALQAEADKLRAFSSGVDYYLTKPFSYEVMVARVKAVLRRTNGNGSSQRGVFAAGDLVIDVIKRRVLREGQAINLTPTEFRLLATLARHRGRPLPYDYLLGEVWGPGYRFESYHIKRYVWSLRQKLEGDPASPAYIHTERGFGYRFG